MKDILDKLDNFHEIEEIIIKNLAIPNTDLNIIIKLKNELKESTPILFKNVSSLNFDSDYQVSSDKIYIIIQDVSSLQWEGVRYKVSILDETMSFYCNKIELNRYN